MENNGAQCVPVATSDADQLAALVELARLGDDHAFTRLHERFEQDIFNYLYRQTHHDPELARDLTQDTFLKAWLAIGRTEEGLRFGPWLRRIASNRFLDHARHVRLVQMERWEAHVDAHGAAKTIAARAIQGWHVGGFAGLADRLEERPEQALLQAELCAQVRQVLDTLHPHYRRCLILREYCDLSYDQLAGVLHTTRAAVKSLLFRAREEFRQHCACDSGYCGREE